jgi:hypothetical protein
MMSDAEFRLEDGVRRAGQTPCWKPALPALAEIGTFGRFTDLLTANQLFPIITHPTH